MEMAFSRGSMIAITVLRVLVGWHFLYEGLTKLNAASWSSAGYLKAARGPLAGFFHGLAANPGQLANADMVTMWGLTIAIPLAVLGSMVQVRISRLTDAVQQHVSEFLEDFDTARS